MAKLTKNIQILMVFVLIVSLCAPALMIAAPQTAKPLVLAGIQPALAQIAAERPEELVRVVVQKADDTNQVEKLVEKLGGKIIKELALINATVISLPGKDLSRLAESPSINWISLDAQMLPAVAATASEPDYTIRDEFNNQAYNGNDGNVAWLGDWQELGESDGHKNGRIEIKKEDECTSGACVRIDCDEDDLDGLGISRAADLRGADSATLSFDYLRDHDEGSAVIYPMVSADDGQTWNVLDKISLRENDHAPLTAKYNLTPFISSHLELRFALSGDEYEGKLFIDNIEIAFEIDQNNYRQTLAVDQLHDDGITGQGVSVAVIDSGIGNHADFSERLYVTEEYGAGDVFGHGTHVAGIIGSDGSASFGAYTGVAPGAKFINLGVSDAYGMAYESDVVEAMQWVFENKDSLNIRVVNLSLNSTLEDSYHNSPIPAAAEILWFNGVVVVASVGNTGAGSEYNTARTSPANDPFIITVGASDENDSADIDDDAITSFSANGTTLDGHLRPDLIAPGYDIISALSSDSSWVDQHPDRVGFDGEYIRLSGTSMSAPMVTGVVALLLQDEPNLTPDQVKFRLLDTGSDLGGYPYLNAQAAVYGTSTESANQDLMPHMLLAKMAMIAYWASVNGGENIDWGNIDWGSVNWNSVNWNSVNWNSVNWNSVNWNSVNWNSVNWNSVNWNSVNWNSVNWNSVNWNSVNWNSVQMNGLFIE